MRILPLLLCLALLAGCKKRPQPTLPQMPDASPIGGGGNTELPEAMLFHTVYRYAGHANQVHGFFAPEMEKRGAKQGGDVWSDDNLEHAGDFGGQGSATPRDPTRPGIWVAVMELPNETRIDVWESVPKAH
jgi:hypothetical protein